MQRLLIALALTCVLSGSALAGTIPTMGAPSPDNAPATASNQDGTDQSPVSELSLPTLLTILDVLF
jgi:hypothetical protein